MQVVRLNPILCCHIPCNSQHYFVSTSATAIPVNRCLTECDFIRETPPVYGQTEHFESTIFRNKKSSEVRSAVIAVIIKPSSGIARGELRST